MELEATIAQYNWTLLGISVILLSVLTFISLKVKPLRNAQKKILFIGMIVAVIVPTLFLITSTIYLNAISVSKGPVHWHADFEIWACGEELELKDPEGLSNKIGTATLHEHNDKRIHLEGVVVEMPDASLGNFFHVIGGELTADTISVPTEDQGLLEFTSGDTCPSGAEGEVQVFVYRTNGTMYAQEKLADPAGYIMAPESVVPPGDCIIVEFDEPKERTDRLCRSYQVAEEIGKLEGEVRDGN